MQKKKRLRHKGKFISKSEEDEIREIKKQHPKKKMDSIIEKYFEDNYITAVEDDIPITELISDVEYFANKNPNLKVYVKPVGENRYIKFSTINGASFFLNTQLSGIWRNIKQAQKDAGLDTNKKNDTNIPVIDFEITYKGRGQTGDTLHLDLNTVSNDFFDVDNTDLDLFY